MIARDELVRMFKELEPATQLDVWNRFVFENDGKEFDLNYFADAVDSQKNFWTARQDVYEDNKGDDDFEDMWEIEVAKTVQLSKNYRFHEKYVRYYMDKDIKEWVLESSNYVLDLIKKAWDDTPIYETDTFVAWFGKYVMDKLNGKGE